jgi:membrane protein HdeD
VKWGAILLIILGLIVLAFPLLGLVPAAIITGFLVLLLGLGLLIGGIMEMGESAGLGILEIILGIIAIILGIGFIFDSALFAFVAAWIVIIVGLFLLIVGLVQIISKSGGSRWTGLVPLIIGILYIVLGYLVKTDPVVLGILIGLWLLIVGIMMLFQSD